MKLIGTHEEIILLKRSIKASTCSPLCDHKPNCKKPADMTCGEYIISMIEVEENNEQSKS
jgi:hypothetical protein